MEEGKPGPQYPGVECPNEHWPTEAEREQVRAVARGALPEGKPFPGTGNREPGTGNCFWAIYGAGKGAEQAEAVAQFPPVCLIDDDPQRQAAGALSWEQFLATGTRQVEVFCAVADRAARLRIRDKVHAAGLRMHTLVAARAAVCPGAAIGEGCYLEPGCVVEAGAVLGECVQVGPGAVVCHHTRIGDGVHVAPGAVIGSSVEIGPLAFIGTHATVESFSRVGREAMVQAGAHVAGDVGDLELVGGAAPKIRGKVKPSGYADPPEDLGFVGGANL